MIILLQKLILKGGNYFRVTFLYNLWLYKSVGTSFQLVPTNKSTSKIPVTDHSRDVRYLSSVSQNRKV